MCVIGRNTFIGAGNTFTDYNLVSAPIKALDGKDKLADANRPVLGGCVGIIVVSGRECHLPGAYHRIGRGSFRFQGRRVIDRDIRYEDSDHHKLKDATKHLRRYPRRGESDLTSW